MGRKKECWLSPCADMGGKQLPIEQAVFVNRQCEDITTAYYFGIHVIKDKIAQAVNNGFVPIVLIWLNHVGVSTDDQVCTGIDGYMGKMVLMCIEGGKMVLWFILLQSGTPWFENQGLVKASRHLTSPSLY